MQIFRPSTAKFFNEEISHNKLLLLLAIGMFILLTFFFVLVTDQKQQDNWRKLQPRRRRIRTKLDKNKK